MLGLKSDTVFRIELACLGPRLASAELIRARTDGKTSARVEIFAAKRESRREKASLAPALRGATCSPKLLRRAERQLHGGAT